MSLFFRFHIKNGLIFRILFFTKNFKGAEYPDTLSLNAFLRGFRRGGRLSFGFGVGGNGHGTLAQLSVVCSLVNGFVGVDSYTRVRDDITGSNK